MPLWCKAQLGTGTPAGNPSLEGPAEAEEAGALRASKLGGAACSPRAPRVAAGRGPTEPLDGEPPDGADGAIDGDRAEPTGGADPAGDDATGTCARGEPPDPRATPGECADRAPTERPAGKPGGPPRTLPLGAFPNWSATTTPTALTTSANAASTAPRAARELGGPSHRLIRPRQNAQPREPSPALLMPASSALPVT